MLAERLDDAVSSARRALALAREHFTSATTMYREMGMRFWLEHVEAETKEMA